MTRPNHDIPNLLLGGVKDYASDQEISDEEAHAVLLRLALVEVDILTEDMLDSGPSGD